MWKGKRDLTRSLGLGWDCTGLKQKGRRKINHLCRHCESKGRSGKKTQKKEGELLNGQDLKSKWYEASKVTASERWDTEEGQIWN
jgi:hypothetical protein